VENPELVAKVERWLRHVSAALHRLSRQGHVLRQKRTQTMMGAMSADQAEATLSRFAHWRHEDRNELRADIVSRLRRAGL